MTRRAHVASANSRRPARLALGLAALLLPSAVQAQRPTVAERTGIRRAARAADEAMDRGDLEGALQLYQAAFRTDPSPALRRRLADCYEAMRRPLEAVHHLERLLEESPDASATERAEIVARAQRLRAGLATVRVRVQPRDEQDLTLTVDGLTIGPDGTAQVSAGAHVVEVTAGGFRLETREFRAAPGEVVNVSISLRHNDIVAPTARPSPPPTPPRGLPPGAFFASLGATVAVAGVWAAAGVNALEARAAYDNAQRSWLAQRPPEALAARTEALARMDRMALLADVAMGVGLAGVALTVVLATQTNFRPPRVELDASAAQGGVTLGLRGRF